MASQLIEEVTAHVQRDNLEDAREICADGTYFLNNFSIYSYFLTLYMFRAHRAHHQERQIVSIQPLVAVGGCVVCRCVAETCAFTPFSALSWLVGWLFDWLVA